MMEEKTELKHLYKTNAKTDETKDYGPVSEEDLKAITKGYKYDEELEIWYKHGSNWGFFLA